MSKIEKDEHLDLSHQPKSSNTHEVVSPDTKIDILRGIISSLSLHVSEYDQKWSEVDIAHIPKIKNVPPGPYSKAIHTLASKHTKGFSSQVNAFPIVFEKAHGVTMEDVDGNVYIDFSSGIVVANVGHSHPMVTHAVNKAASNLMNCHDFTTGPKALLLWKLSMTSFNLFLKKLR